MPKGPQGQKRPADAVSRAVMVAQIATGEIEDDGYAQKSSVKRGSAGGAARAKALSPQKRKSVAAAGAAARWNERRLEVTEQTRLMRALFEHQGRDHVDIKFLRGSSNNVSIESVCHEANSAIFQIDSGLIEGDSEFNETFKQVDVVELMKNI
jgi:hypothetical protein